MTRPLSAYRVVELGTLPAGAYAARLFADFGAEVIKVEPPDGDPTRTFPPMIDARTAAGSPISTTARRASRRTRSISMHC